jgi:hypothetical protein
LCFGSKLNNSKPYIWLHQACSKLNGLIVRGEGERERGRGEREEERGGEGEREKGEKEREEEGGGRERERERESSILYLLRKIPHLIKVAGTY